MSEAPYLDTQTLGGDAGYFHDSDDADHATDGSAQNQSPKTSLVAASAEQPAEAQRPASTAGTASASNMTTTTTAQPATPEDDGLEQLTNAQLTSLAKQRGVELPKRANKAQMVAALRGE